MITLGTITPTSPLSNPVVISALVTGMVGISLAVLGWFGGYLKGRSERKEHRKDRLREAYADWITSLRRGVDSDRRFAIMRQQAAQPDHKAMPPEVLHRMMDEAARISQEVQQAQWQEDAAFNRVLILDTNETRLKDAQDIRLMNPLKTALNEHVEINNRNIDAALEIMTVTEQEQCDAISALLRKLRNELRS